MGLSDERGEKMNYKQYSFLLLLALISGLVGSVLGIKFFMGIPLSNWAQSDKIVMANTFQLVNQDGQAYLDLDLMEGGNPGLIFYDMDKRIRVVFDMTDKGDPRLFLFDGNERIRTILGLKEDGNPFIQLRDKKRNII